MGYVGNQTTTAFTSMDKQDITGNGGANYTLSHAVANANEIEVFVNNVRQESGVAYTTSGTALNMTGNVASTDSFYVVYQGKAVGTIVTPDGSVSTAKIADDAVTSAKLDTNIAISGNLDVGTIRSTNGTAAMTIDSSGRILQPTKPAFRVKFNGNTPAINISANTELSWNTYGSVDFDIGGHFDLANSKYVVPITGLYQINLQIAIESVSSSTGVYAYVNVNGSNLYMGSISDPQGGGYETSRYSGLLSFSAGDELKTQCRTITDTSVIIRGVTTDFSGYLIG